MMERARHPSGFYTSLFADTRDRGCNLKYRPKSKPIAVGVFEVEQIVAKWIQRSKSEFFIQWKDYSSAEDTWEPSEHVLEELIAAFKSRCVDPVRTDECKERLALLSERGLKSPFGCNEMIIMRHDVLRSIFPGLPSGLGSTLYLVSEEELLTAGLGPYLKRILTMTGGGCHVKTLVKLKLLLGKSPVFLDVSGRKTSSCPAEKVQVQFTKCYFTGQMQWDASCCSNVNKTASLEATKQNKKQWPTVCFHLLIIRPKRTEKPLVKSNSLMETVNRHNWKQKTNTNLFSYTFLNHFNSFILISHQNHVDLGMFCDPTGRTINFLERRKSSIMAKHARASGFFGSSFPCRWEKVELKKLDALAVHSEKNGWFLHHFADRLWVVPISLSPSCVTQKKTARKILAPGFRAGHFFLKQKTFNNGKQKTNIYQLYPAFEAFLALSAAPTRSALLGLPMGPC